MAKSNKQIRIHRTVSSVGLGIRIAFDAASGGLGATVLIYLDKYQQLTKADLDRLMETIDREVRGALAPGEWLDMQRKIGEDDAQ